MGSSSTKGSLHPETSLPCKQEKIMFSAHRIGSVNTPLHLLILAHKHIHLQSLTDKNFEHIYYWTHWHKENPTGIKMAHRHTAAETHTWVRWPRVQRRNQWSIFPGMTDLLIRHRWACFMFKMLLVQSWHHWWATTAEPLGLRHWNALRILLCVLR